MAVRSASELAAAGWDHLWMNFTAIRESDEPLRVLIEGAGCHVTDASGDRFFDGLSGMFCVNVGYGRESIAEAAAAQIRTLSYGQAWGAANAPAIELAEKIADLAGHGFNRVFFTSGGSESVESAIKLARDYHLARGDSKRLKIIARQMAYHGTTLGALRATGLEGLREHFIPMIPEGGFHVPNTDNYRRPADVDPLFAADAIEETILREGAETVSAVILEPIQNYGGCLTPPDGYFERVREICDRHGVLLISDEVIAAWGRLGEWFGFQRYGYQPDIVTTAKGISSAYVPLGAVLASDKVAAPFLDGTAIYAHGFTFGGHPVAAAVALANIDIMERENLPGHVREHEGAFRTALEGLLDIPIVGDVRGDGFFYAIELVRDQVTKQKFAPDETAEWCRRIPEEMAARGLLTRVAPQTGTPIITLAPPLIATEEDFDFVTGVIRESVEVAARGLGLR